MCRNRHTLQGPPTQTGVVAPEGLLSYLLPLGPFVDLKLIHWSIQVSLWSVFTSGYGHTFTSAAAALELICTSSLPACTQVLKHTCMWRNSRPTEWGQGDFLHSSDTWASAHWACAVGGSVQGYSRAISHCLIGFRAAAFPSQSLSPDFC